MCVTIEELISREDWKAARKLIKSELKLNPSDPHWLLTRLGLTYYEERKYSIALEYSEQAFVIAPDCPLVLWDYAGTLDMLGRSQDAILLYQRILDRGLESLAFGDCGEGRARARGLYVDSLYRMSRCFKKLGNRDRAKELLTLHMDGRGPGCQSIYPIAKVRDELKSLET